MVNGISVLGWGVGGIEAEAAMLGRPITMIVPQVVGVHLSGQLSEGVTATDLVLKLFRCFVERGWWVSLWSFMGQVWITWELRIGRPLPIWPPSTGPPVVFFPIDRETLNYLRLTGRDDHQIALVEQYAKAQGVWREWGQGDGPRYSSQMSLHMGGVVSSLAGYKRPQDRIDLKDVKESFRQSLRESLQVQDIRSQPMKGDEQLSDGDVVIAAITSCTNTSNPSVMLAAGLLAKKAVERGLMVKPWVKTSLAPGSQVVEEYLSRTGCSSHWSN